MHTAIVSDLHLGSGHGEDILRDPAIRAVLCEEIAGAGRVVLLGDVLELRETTLADALEVARPFFEELGQALGAKPVVLVPGNHDHRLAEPLLEALAVSAEPALGLERRAVPAGDAAQRIAEWLGPAELTIAYPGIWLRDDVYATHGHYMDCHMSLPRLECIAAAALMRSGNRPPDPATPRDYERILRPIYGLAFGIAQSGLRAGSSRPSERAWRALAGNSDRQPSVIAKALRRAAFGAAIPAAVWTLNRALHADFQAHLTNEAITRSGIEAASELARRLQTGASHFITGHTHRGGPEEEDGSWPLDGGGTLHNTGNWVFASAFHHPGRPPGPYWPGTVTWLEQSGAPRRARLLREHSHASLQKTVSRVLPA